MSIRSASGVGFTTGTCAEAHGTGNTLPTVIAAPAPAARNPRRVSFRLLISCPQFHASLSHNCRSMTAQLNKYSSRITQPKSQGASQAMLYATGLSDEDMNKPQVGISSVWFEGNSCNMHLLQLAEKVKDGVKAAGLVGFRFNTIGVSDGDSIETVMNAQWYDANISLPGCDKNMPGCIMAMGRLNRPALMVYGGTIRA